MKSPGSTAVLKYGWTDITTVSKYVKTSTTNATEEVLDPNAALLKCVKKSSTAVSKSTETTTMVAEDVVCPDTAVLKRV